MSNNLTISNQPPQSTASDYEKLREMGIAYIEQFARDLWTDYNKHDPGITTLELLAYAITDLSLRTQLPMRDLLTSAWEDVDKMKESFVTADLVLPICPVTELDYRKIFIDLDGVRNAWLFKHKQSVFVNCTKSELRATPPPPPDKFMSFDLNGLLDILIDFDDFYLKQQINGGVTEGVAKQAILDKVKETYRDNRNLCEDIAHVKEVPMHTIMLCADVEIAPDAVVAEVYAQILFLVQNYLDPPIKRYSLAEMKAKTDADDMPLRLDQIFEGPLLQQGFILDAELEAAQLREVVYTSDIINIIMGIAGVKAVKKVRLNSLIPEAGKPCGEWKTPTKEGASWCLHVPAGHQPRLCFEKSALAFYKDIIPVGNQSDKIKALNRLRDLQQADYEANKKSVDTVPVPSGEVLPIGEYPSIINDFPQTYGIGKYGLPDTLPVARHAKAKQFKAYLLFFDQILANYVAQLKNAHRLFSADMAAATYFGQPVTGVKDLPELYYDDPSVIDDGYANMSAILKNILAEQEDFENNLVRKNRFLDHLLARFAESFSEYALLMHSLFGERSGEEILQDKVAFLKDFYQCPSRLVAESETDWLKRCRQHFHQVCRARAYNYCKPAWETENVAGVTRRLARLVGIRNHQAHIVSDRILVDAEDNGSGQFQYLVRTKTGVILIKSIALFSDKDTAMKQGYADLVKPVPTRAQFDIQNTSAKWFFTIKNQKGDVVLAQSPDFASRALARQAVSDFVEYLIYSGESIFIVENILLRPDTTQITEGWMNVCVEPDCSFCKPLDPYSYRVSVILPGYTTRFSDINYRRYIERIIRTELPAHVLARICWVSRKQLEKFETVYRQWLDEKSTTCDVKSAQYANALNDLIATLEALYSIYPAGVLHNCDTADENSPIVLGQSTLGSL